MTADLRQDLESLFRPYFHSHPKSIVEHGLIPECVQGHRNCSKTIKTPAGYLLKCLCRSGHDSHPEKEL